MRQHRAIQRLLVGEVRTDHWTLFDRGAERAGSSARRHPADLASVSRQNQRSPFDVVIIPAINKNDNSNLDKAKKVYKELKNKGIDVLLDDVEENISNKFKKHDLLGIPFQIIVGSKAKKDEFEFKEVDKDSQMTNLDNIIKLLKN